MTTQQPAFGKVLMLGRWVPIPIFYANPSLRWVFSFYTPVDFYIKDYKMNKDEKIREMKFKYAMMALSAFSLCEAACIEGSPFNADAKSAREPQLDEPLAHITAHPADPLYNSFILLATPVQGEKALKELQEQFIRQYPKKEVLYYTGQAFNAFIQKQPVILLTNFHKLHPNLLAVLIENLDITRFPVEEQTKMAAFLKQLVAQKIQVVSSIRHGFEMPSAGQYYPLARELWSWYMSGRVYTLRQ